VYIIEGFELIFPHQLEIGESIEIVGVICWLTLQIFDFDIQ